MQIKEILREDTNNAEANLITAINLLQNRANDTGGAPVISTQSLINLVRNTDQMFNYDALVQAHKNNDAVKNLIKSFNKDEITLSSVESYDEVDSGSDSKGNEHTVPSMAKKAGKSRSPNLF